MTVRLEALEAKLADECGHYPAFREDLDTDRPDARRTGPDREACGEPD